MAEHIPKTDDEIDWEKIAHKAEKEDYQRQQKRSFFKMNFDWASEKRFELAIGALAFIALVKLFLYLFLVWAVPYLHWD